jgi:hypothetical protein
MFGSKSICLFTTSAKRSATTQTHVRNEHEIIIEQLNQELQNKGEDIERLTSLLDANNTTANQSTPYPKLRRPPSFMPRWGWEEAKGEIRRLSVALYEATHKLAWRNMSDVLKSVNVLRLLFVSKNVSVLSNKQAQFTYFNVSANLF